MQNIELEHRSLISEDKYCELLTFLGKNAKDLGENDKHTFHFIFPDKLLNIVDLVSKKQSKIALKLGKIGQGSNFGEIEVPIDPKDFEQTVLLFKSLGFTEVIESNQKRHDYEYKGVELAIKYSKEWQYHVELEILLQDETGIPEAEKKIYAVAQELGIQIMTQEELQQITHKIESEHRTKDGNA
jgi:predicted adenylyl cyclase CyaB